MTSPLPRLSLARPGETLPNRPAPGLQIPLLNHLHAQALLDSSEDAQRHLRTVLKKGQTDGRILVAADVLSPLTGPDRRYKLWPLVRPGKPETLLFFSNATATLWQKTAPGQYAMFPALFYLPRRVFFEDLHGGCEIDWEYFSPDRPLAEPVVRSLNGHSKNAELTERVRAAFHWEVEQWLGAGLDLRLWTSTAASNATPQDETYLPFWLPASTMSKDHREKISDFLQAGIHAIGALRNSKAPDRPNLKIMPARILSEGHLAPPRLLLGNADRPPEKGTLGHALDRTLQDPAFPVPARAMISSATLLHDASATVSGESSAHQRLDAIGRLMEFGFTPHPDDRFLL